MEQIHATCVDIEGSGVLIRGEPGSGKSDLALRLIDEGARLVSDDYTNVEISGKRLVASAPDQIKGLMEIRGVGVVQMGCVKKVDLSLLVDLVEIGLVERLPEESDEEILGAAIRRISLFSFEASATAKVRFALKAATGLIIQKT